MTIFILDGNKMTGKESAYAHIAKVCLFPSYFGNNLDALADCLSEVDRDAVIILINRDSMLEALGDYGFRILEVFRENSIGRYSFVEK